MCILFKELDSINSRPRPFEFYTAAELWTDEHTSKRMLSFHLNEDIDVSSRKAAFIQKSADWIVAHFGLSGDSRVADFGCGPGLYAMRLARKGIRVTGIDFSERSIKYAIEKAGTEGLSINYIKQNYLDFESAERFDLIMMIMCDFCALSPAQRKAMLAKFHKLLIPGGCILIDVYSLAAFDRRQEAAGYELNQLDGFWSPNRYYAFLNTFKYGEVKVTLDKYTIVESSRIRTVYNWLQHFSPESIGAELSDSGFRIKNLFGDVAGKPFDPQDGEFAVAAERL